MTLGLATVACGPSLPDPQPKSALGEGTSAPPGSVTSTVGPVAEPTETASAPAPCREPRAYIQFAINVHDWIHYDESADTLLRAIDLFERYGARADFYLMGVMVKVYRQHRPDVIERLRDSHQTISYHVRPPHPVYTGFDRPLQGLSESELRRRILEYETYGLDLGTGELLRGEAGGLSLVAEEMGRVPVVASAPSSNARIRSAALEVYRSLGARMAVFFHEEGTKPETPFEWRSGMLARPSDFSITRWTDGQIGADAGRGQFWWNMMDTAHEAAFNPAAYLKARMREWNQERPALLTALIHENNWNRSGPEAWTPIYWADTAKEVPNEPPFNLGAQDPSKVRKDGQKEAIWAAYEELVACAASEFAIASSEEILALAEASGTSGQIGPRC